MQKSSLCGTKSLYSSVPRITAPPLLKNYKDSTGQRSKIHKSAQSYLYQIDRLSVNGNLRKTNPTTVAICQNSGKKCVLYGNTLLFWCFLRHNLLNLPKGKNVKEIEMEFWYNRACGKQECFGKFIWEIRVKAKP